MLTPSVIILIVTIKSIMLNVIMPSVVMLIVAMEQRTLKNVNNYLNTNIYYYLETSGGQSSNLYLNAVHFFNTSFI